MLLGALAVIGCHTNYQLTLNNGNRITASTKPRLVEGYYVFKDMKGYTNRVSEGRVRAIEPQPSGHNQSSSHNQTPTSTSFDKP
jgi:hypothetical protein